MQERALPEKLYKYYNPGRISFLNDRLVCFSTISQLNDPFEGVSISTALFPQEGKGSIHDRAQAINFKKEAYKRLFSRAIDSGVSVVEADKLAKSIVAQDALMDWAKEQIIRWASKAAETAPLNTSMLEQELASSVGVFCLSANPLSAPMWAHYAGNYSGFLVEFLTDHEFLSAPGLQKVRPIIYEMRTLSNWSQIEDSDLLARKSVEWSYEQEWRSARDLEAATKVTEGYHLFEVRADAVSAIIVSDMSTPEVVTKAKEAKLRFGWPIKQVKADRIEKKLKMADTAQ